MCVQRIQKGREGVQRARRTARMVAARIRYSLNHSGVCKTLGHAFWGVVHWLEGAAFDYERGTYTNGVVGLQDLTGMTSESLSYGVRYQPSPPRCVRNLISKIDIQHESFIFVDYGSGKGRALLIAAEYPFRQMLAFSTAIHNAWKSQKARFPHFHSADGFLSSPVRAKKEQLISCALD